MTINKFPHTFGKLVMTLLVLSFTISTYAQELNCTVDIEFSKIQSTDPKVFQTLQSSITEFMNNRKWTDDAYQPHEKIDCSIIINIDQELSSSEFAGQFIIQSERPVYNSSYSTVVFSYKDDNFQFEYNEFDNLEFSDNSYFSNLTSFLAFYAYIIIGFDYDSYSLNGGTPFFLKSQDVVTTIPIGQRARYAGWDPFDGIRNRAILMGHMTNPRYGEFRKANYYWHMKGLDIMYDTPEKGRKVTSESIDLIQELYDDNPTSMLVTVFFLAKGDEIIDLYSNASKSEREDLIEQLVKMDPVNTIKYMEMK